MARRRSLLRRAAGVGAAAVGGVAGCLGGPDPVELLVAGSLADAVENGLRPALAPSVRSRLRVGARGSVGLARLVAAGKRDPAVLSVADPVLFRSVLAVPYHRVFATNALVVAVADTPGGRRVRAAGTDGWFRPVLAGRATLGRTDPDLDPLGYRTLFVLELAGEHYGLDRNLRATLAGRDGDGGDPERAGTGGPGTGTGDGGDGDGAGTGDPTGGGPRSRVYPETGLLARLETGAVDAAVVYRSMAVSHGRPFVDLPAAVDLSDPGRADRYARARYELPDGAVVAGAPIRYAATLRPAGGSEGAPGPGGGASGVGSGRSVAGTDADGSGAAATVFEAHTTGGYLREFGFGVPAAYPREVGRVPDALG